MRAVKTVQECASLVGLNVQLRDLTSIPVTNEEVRRVGPYKTGWASQLRSGLIHFIPFNHRWFQTGSIRIDLPYHEQGDDEHRRWKQVSAHLFLGHRCFCFNDSEAWSDTNASIVATLTAHEGKGTNDSDEG